MVDVRSTWAAGFWWWGDDRQWGLVDVKQATGWWVLCGGVVWREDGEAAMVVRRWEFGLVMERFSSVFFFFKNEEEDEQCLFFSSFSSPILFHVFVPLSLFKNLLLWKFFQTPLFSHVPFCFLSNPPARFFLSRSVFFFFQKFCFLKFLPLFHVLSPPFFKLFNLLKFPIPCVLSLFKGHGPHVCRGPRHVSPMRGGVRIIMGQVRKLGLKTGSLNPNIILCTDPRIKTRCYSFSPM